MNDKYKKHFIRAGQLAKEVRAYGKSLVVPGASYNDVVNKITHKIHELGAIPAFPPQLALDTVAAHFLPQPDEDIVFSTQLVKLDIGVCFKGAIGDCAVTIDLSGKYQKLFEATEEALLQAEQIVKVGLPIREIGKIIESTLTTRGFKPIKNLAGHGLGYYKIHTPPSIPNYDNRSEARIKAGMTFAIEPFGTNGKGLIHEQGEATIFSLICLRPIRSELAHKLLKKIKTFNGLPFALHDLLGDGCTLQEVKQGVKELINHDIIAGYAPLVEEGKGYVCQAENSVLVDENGQVLITTR